VVDGIDKTYRVQFHAMRSNKGIITVQLTQFFS